MHREFETIFLKLHLFCSIFCLDSLLLLQVLFAPRQSKNASQLGFENILLQLHFISHSFCGLTVYFFVSTFYALTIYKTQCSLTLKQYFWNYILFCSVFSVGQFTFLQVRFAPWQSIKCITAWLWNNIFETTFYFAAFLRLDSLLLLQVRFTAWQFVKLIAAWLWNFISVTVFYFAGVLRLDNKLFIASSFCSLTIYKIHFALTFAK